MYAMVEIKGGQYRAEKGGLLTVQRVPSEQGDVVEFDTVLLLRDDAKVVIGEPYVAGARVKAVVQEQKRGDKVIVHKYKRRKRYRRTRGHRQHFTVLRVEEITSS